MLEMPEADPTCSSRTALVEAAEHGPLVIPMPQATASIGNTKAAYFQDDSTKVKATKPAVVTTNPARTTWRVPHLAAILGTIGAQITSPTVAGSVASPACSALRSRPAGFWKYRLTMNIRPLMVPAPMRMPRVDPMSTLLRSRARSTSGAGEV